MDESGLLSKLKEDLKQAQKQKDQLRLSVLRLLISDIKNSEIQKKKALAEDEIIAVLSSRAKKHRDSIEQFEKAGRTDLSEKEKSELGVIAKYLPSQIGKQELRDLVRQTVADLKSRGEPSMGQVMGAVMPKTKGRADGALISKIVKEELN